MRFELFLQVDSSFELIIKMGGFEGLSKAKDSTPPSTLNPVSRGTSIAYLTCCHLEVVFKTSSSVEVEKVQLG